jgi:hypothetical protein
MRDEGPKLFTIDEANKLIPRITEAIKELRAQRESIWKAEQQRAVEELSWLRADGTVSPKAQAQVTLLEKVVDDEMKKFERGLEIFSELGVALKDLDEGLVDFFAARGDTLVYLCWKEGENKIAFWHHIETGFAGRKPLSEF